MASRVCAAPVGRRSLAGDGETSTVTVLLGPGAAAAAVEVAGWAGVAGVGRRGLIARGVHVAEPRVGLGPRAPHGASLLDEVLGDPDVLDAEELREELAACKGLRGVADVRVKGAIGAIELSGEIDLEHLRRRFAECGVWIRPFSNVVYLMPPYVISAGDLSVLTSAIHQVLLERTINL